MADIDWAAVDKRVGQEDAPAAPSTDIGSYAAGFAKSMMESVPETIGIMPSLETEQFRAQYPISGLASELIPGALTYGGWYKASTKIPAFAKMLGSIGVSGSTPVISGAVREVARYAPLELGKIGASAAIGDNTKDVAEAGALNLAVAGAAGGVGGLLRAGGPLVPPIPEISAEVNQRDAWPLQLRQLKAAKAANKVTSEEAADYHIANLQKVVRAEEPQGSPYVNTLEGQEKAPKQLNRLFNSAGTAKSIERLKFTPGNWEPEDLAKAIKDSDLEGNEDLMQFPRYVRPVNEKGAAEVSSAITENLKSIGNDVWLGKEADDGLYIVAKRFEKGEPITPEARKFNRAMDRQQEAQDVELGLGQYGVKPKPVEGTSTEAFNPGDKWILFKTDQPQKFSPLGTEWMNKIVDTGAWDTIDYSAPTGTTLNNALQKAKDLIGFRNFKDTGPDWQSALKKRLGVNSLVGEAGQAAGKTYEWAKSFAAPSTWQFTNSPRASYIFNVAKNVFDAGKGIANSILHGDQEMKEYSLVKSVLTGEGGSTTRNGKPAVFPMIDALFQNDKDVFDVWRAQQGGWDADGIKAAMLKGEISPKAAEFLQHLDSVDEEQFAELVKTQTAFGVKPSTALAGHRMISNTFTGTIRSPIFDEKGNLVALASGKNAASAIKEADFILAGAKDEGRNWTKGFKGKDWFTSDYSTDLQTLLDGAPTALIRARPNDQTLAASLRERYLRQRLPPGTLQQRTGMGGYVGQATPWTKQELKDIISSHVNQYQSYMAELNVQNGLKGQFSQLASEDSRMSAQVNSRINDLAGRPGPFAVAQNQFVDRVLAPYIGKNSASKIVSVINKFTHHNMLGMFNTSFPILNAMQFMQTVLPQVSFLVKAPRADLAKYYSWALAMGSDGLPRRGMGVLQMAKLMGQSFRELGNPTEELKSFMSQGIREGTLDPKIVEEFAGQNSSTVKHMKDAMGSTGNFVKWAESVSNFLPAASERFSRSHAFTTGYILGRDFFNLKGGDLYSFTKMFTDRTMFGYGVADRAKMLSGPLGNMTGLYKNWQMHYMGWLLEYGNQATKGNIAPLLWAMGGTTAVGGVAASPLYFAADGMSRLFTHKTAMQQIYDHFGPADQGSTAISDGIYYGLPSFLGFSLQGSASAPGANPVQDASMMFSLVQYQRAKALGKAIGAAIDYTGDTGENPVRDRATRDALIQAFAPKSIIRLAQASEDGVIRSMNTGNSQAVATPTERMLYSLGLTPVGVAKQMDVATELYNSQEKMKAAVQTYGEAWHQATKNQNWTELQKIMLRAMASGVPLDSIIHSATAREGKEEQDALSRRFKAEEIAKMTSIIGQPR